MPKRHKPKPNARFVEAGGRRKPFALTSHCSYIDDDHGPAENLPQRGQRGTRASHTAHRPFSDTRQPFNDTRRPFKDIHQSFNDTNFNRIDEDKRKSRSGPGNIYLGGSRSSRLRCPGIAHRHRELKSQSEFIRSKLEQLIKMIEELQPDPDAMDWTISPGTICYVPVPTTQVVQPEIVETALELSRQGVVALRYSAEEQQPDSWTESNQPQSQLQPQCQPRNPAPPSNPQEPTDTGCAQRARENANKSVASAQRPSQTGFDVPAFTAFQNSTQLGTKEMIPGPSYTGKYATMPEASSSGLLGETTLPEPESPVQPRATCKISSKFHTPKCSDWRGSLEEEIPGGLRAKAGE